jgi:DNA-binding transcriptional LysR family regulator
MDLSNVDLNLLVALDALLAERSVTNAGRRVHLSQSAMSGALARLRQMFNDELLISGRGGMTLTALAEELVEPVDQILRQVQDTLSTTIRFDPASSSRRFTIAASDYVVVVLLERALREIHRQAPGVSVTIVPLRDRMEKLENPAIDLVVLPKAHVPSGRSCIPLFTDAFTAIVAADHPTVGTALSVDDYRSLGHVVVTFASDRPVSDDQVAAVEAGLTPRIAVVAPSYLALPGLVVGTTHVATIQRRLATHLAAMYPLKEVALPVELPPLEEVMIWHQRFERDTGHQWFRGVLTNVASTFLSPLANSTTG